MEMNVPHTSETCFRGISLPRRLHTGMEPTPNWLMKSRPIGGRFLWLNIGLEILGVGLEKSKIVYVQIAMQLIVKFARNL